MYDNDTYTHTCMHAYAHLTVIPPYLHPNSIASRSWSRRSRTWAAIDGVELICSISSKLFGSTRSMKSYIYIYIYYLLHHTIGPKMHDLRCNKNLDEKKGIGSTTFSSSNLWTATNLQGLSFLTVSLCCDSVISLKCRVSLNSMFFWQLADGWIDAPSEIVLWEDNCLGFWGRAGW